MKNDVESRAFDSSATISVCSARMHNTHREFVLGQKGNTKKREKKRRATRVDTGACDHNYAPLLSGLVPAVSSSQRIPDTIITVAVTET